MPIQIPHIIELPPEKVPVIDETDVVVVGGGTSGFIATTAAARTGAHTILVERFGFLGGCTTITYNTSIGLFFNSNNQQIIGGRTCLKPGAESAVRQVRHCPTAADPPQPGRDPVHTIKTRHETCRNPTY